jgi:hypothetical protein
MTKIKNPLSETFGFAEPGSFVDENSFDIIEADHIDDGYIALQPDPNLPKKVEDDAEDKEVTEKINSIFDAAMEAYQNQTAYVEILEPRYAARNAEVANSYLNTALSAVSLKAKVKNEKKKLASPGGFIPFGNNTTNNVVVADRNELLRMINDRKNKTIID